MSQRRPRLPQKAIPAPVKASIITMNVGTVDIETVSTVDLATVAAIETVMANDEGYLPGGCLHIDIIRPHDADNTPANGAAMFVITDKAGEGSTTYIRTVCCWNARLNKEVWPLAHQQYRELHRKLNQGVLTPEFPTVPPIGKPIGGAWMAEIIYPAAETLDVENIRAAKKASKAIFWWLAGALKAPA